MTVVGAETIGIYSRKRDVSKFDEVTGGGLARITVTKAASKFASVPFKLQYALARGLHIEPSTKSRLEVRGNSASTNRWNGILRWEFL